MWCNNSFGDVRDSSGPPPKFRPVTTSDVVAVNGENTIVKLRYYSITILEHYRSKSFEELRLEHYVNNRFQSNCRFPAFPNPFVQNHEFHMFESAEKSLKREDEAMPSIGTCVKFVPIVDRESSEGSNYILANRNIRYQCITIMKEYDTMSFEELRFQNYRNKLHRKSKEGTTNHLNKSPFSLHKITATGTKIKYRYTRGSDDVGIVIDGKLKRVEARLQCITLMDQYKNKSFEELRFEDYKDMKPRIKFTPDFNVFRPSCKANFTTKRKIQSSNINTNVPAAEENNVSSDGNQSNALSLFSEVLKMQKSINNKLKKMSSGVNKLVKVKADLQKMICDPQLMQQEKDEDSCHHRIVILGLNTYMNGRVDEMDCKELIVNLFQDQLGYEIGQDDIVRLDVIKCKNGKNHNPVIVELKSAKIENDVLNLAKKLGRSKIVIYKDCCS